LAYCSTASAFVQAVVDVEEQCGAEAKRRGSV
jgi:hypothetical protein